MSFLGYRHTVITVTLTLMWSIAGDFFISDAANEIYEMYKYQLLPLTLPSPSCHATATPNRYQLVPVGTNWLAPDEYDSARIQLS